jgi:predicted Fe-Mo cluster-binding NifX family protein
MKIVITAQGNTLESPVDPRFGRAKNFIVFDTDTKKFSVENNSQNLNAAQGAGIQAAQNVIDTGAEVVITGHCGPKAFRVLNTGKIKIVTGAKGSSQDAINDFLNGKLETADSADVEGHWA